MMMMSESIAERAGRACAGAVALALLLVAGGCRTWRPTREPPASMIAVQERGRVRLALADGRRVVVYTPRVIGDSVMGRAGRPESPRVAYAITDVGDVQTRRVSPARTAALALAIAAAAYGALALFVYIGLGTAAT